YPVIIAESTTALKRLSVSEAVMELDLTGVAVVLFRHAGHGRVNLVYRRGDGHIGWSDPPTTAADCPRASCTSAMVLLRTDLRHPRLPQPTSTIDAAKAGSYVPPPFHDKRKIRPLPDPWMSSMPLADLVAPNAVIAALKVNGKKQLLQELAAKAAELTGQNERTIFEILHQREKLGSTGVGNGGAIPHGKLPKLNKLFGLFARLARPVDFEALDGQPVDLVFLLLAPEGAGADHLKALARVARLLRDGDVVRKLRDSRDAEAI